MEHPFVWVPLVCGLLFALLVELVLVTPIAKYLRLQNAVGLWRILLVFGRATLEIAKNFHSVDNASERRVQARQQLRDRGHARRGGVQSRSIDYATVEPDEEGIEE